MKPTWNQPEPAFCAQGHRTIHSTGQCVTLFKLNGRYFHMVSSCERVSKLLRILESLNQDAAQEAAAR
jgi:hypothetical protein